jgi:hypothetical protein
MAPFLKLEDFLAPLPLPAIMAVLMVLGLKYLGSRLMHRFSAGPPPADQEAAGFMIATALAAATAHLLAMVGAAHLWLLRIMAWSLAACGIMALGKVNRQTLSHLYRHLQEIFREQSFWGKAAIPLLILTGVGLCLAALGPPTDADSLDYHLGVPLDILRHHGAYPRPDWLHARLTGLGESLNMLGLAGGTDILGAALQFAALVAVMAAVTSLATTGRDRLLLCVCIIGCPLVGFLVPNQKPQMLPIAATTIALIVIARNFRGIAPMPLILAVGLVFFAVACRYSFILTGSVVLAATLLAAQRARRLGLALGISLAAYLLLAFPVHWQNFLFYGDPVSPFLERFKTAADPLVTRFAAHLRQLSQGGALPFPFSLFLPTFMGGITTVLGLGPLFFFVAWGEARSQIIPKILLVSALAAVVVLLAFCQVVGRFFFEPYLWIIAAAAAATWGPGKTFLFKLMVCQLLLMTLITGYGTITLFPGALTASLRHQVMTKAAFCYSETRWLDEVLPPEAVVLADIRSMALMPRPFLSSDVLFFFRLEDPAELERFLSLAAARQLNTVVAGFPRPREGMAPLSPYLGGTIADPQEFPHAFRNPWNRGQRERLAAYRFNVEKARPFMDGFPPRTAP